MRIIAGLYKNKPLEFKKTATLRPTRQIVKKSFFDTISYLIKGAVFIDLFAGVGFMGIESLSRGAKKSIFVDLYDDLIRKNLQSLNIALELYDIYKMNAVDFLALDIIANADIIYLDPPYAMQIDKFLDLLLKKINQNAIVCLESDKMIESERVFKIKQFGNNTLNYLR